MIVISKVNWLEKHIAVQSSLKIKCKRVIYLYPIKISYAILIIGNLQTVIFPENSEVVNYIRRSYNILVRKLNQFQLLITKSSTSIFK